VSSSQRRFVLIEQGIGSAIFNFGLNAAIAWLMFRGAERVPLWGQQSIMGDTIGTAFFLPLMTCVIVTPLARRRIRDGKVTPLGWNRMSHPMLDWLPRRVGWRGLVLGIAGLFAFTPLAHVGLSALEVSELTVSGFVLFKATFAALAAALVTPLVALWAIAESDDILLGPAR
jgi:hypothetical protein